MVLSLELHAINLSGAASSGDIDILLTHPNYTSETEKQVSLYELVLQKSCIVFLLY